MCLTELRAVSSGVLWLEEGDDGFAFVHSQSVAVVICGEALGLCTTGSERLRDR